VVVNERTVKEELLERRKLSQFKIRRADLSNSPRSGKTRNEIEETYKSNPTIGKEMSEKFHENIKDEAIEFVELMFRHFTQESFHEFLEGGGEVEDL